MGGIRSRISGHQAGRPAIEDGCCIPSPGNRKGSIVFTIIVDQHVIHFPGIDRQGLDKPIEVSISCSITVP